MAEILEDRPVVVRESELISRHMVDMLREKQADFRDSGEKPPTIYKVPSSLKKEAIDAYEPKLVSIGPLHYRTTVDELSHMQDLKWKYLQDHIDRSPQNNRLEKYVDLIWEQEQRARTQYSIKFDLEPSKFVELLVLDGCFLVEFLIKRALGPVGYPWSAARWNLPMLRNDLLLIENQIPFFVLEIIYENSHVVFPNQVCLTLLDLALHYVSKDKLSAKDLESKLGKGTKVYHLLHLDYLCKLHYFDPMGSSRIRGRSIKRRLAYWFFFLLLWFGMCKRQRKMGRTKDILYRSIPTATELKSAGVQFRKRWGKKECLLNVSFSDEGRLEIPLISLQQYSASSVRNLIALEQCFKGVGHEFTAYIVFMSKLIKDAADVAILRNNDIIEKRLGTDEKVASMFSSVVNGASLTYDPHYLRGLFKDINKYYDSDMARLKREVNEWKSALDAKYSYRPLAIFFFLSAIVLLVVTVVGAGATIWQTVYTVRSYQKQFP